MHKGMKVIQNINYQHPVYIVDNSVALKSYTIESTSYQQNNIAKFTMMLIKN